MTRAHSLRALLVVGFFRDALGHAYLTSPAPRGGVPQVTPGTVGNVPKLQPLAGVSAVVNSNVQGCGDAVTNGAQATPGTPVQTYQAGTQVTVSWTVNVPHPLDNLDTGVRVAIKYSDTDSYSANILAGGVTGEPGVGTIPAGTALGDYSTTFTLPATKTCNPCVLQWVQPGTTDGGYYLYCSDIIIQNTPVTGQAPGVGATTVGGGAATGTNQGGFPQQPGQQNGQMTGNGSGSRGYGMVGASQRSHNAKLALTMFLAGLVFAFLHQ